MPCQDCQDAQEAIAEVMRQMRLLLLVIQMQDAQIKDMCELYGDEGDSMLDGYGRPN